MKRKYIFSTISIIIICMVLPYIGLAQPTGGCDPEDPLCPIDGGVSLLIAAGIGLGAKKAYQERNKKNAVTENPAN